MQRLNAALTPLPSGAYRAPVHLAPATFRERFVAESLIEEATDRPIQVGFGARPPAGCIAIHRAHPLPAVLAGTFLEQALDPPPDDTGLSVLPRTGAWVSDGVEEVTWLAVLRVRYKLNARGKFGPGFSMAEEATAIAFSALHQSRLAHGNGAFALLDHESLDLAPELQRDDIERGLSALPELKAQLDSYAAERAAALAEDHTRVRHSLGSRAQVQVEAVTPVDVIGFYVLMPSL